MVDLCGGKVGRFRVCGMAACGFGGLVVRTAVARGCIVWSWRLWEDFDLRVCCFLWDFPAYISGMMEFRICGSTSTCSARYGALGVGEGAF